MHASARCLTASLAIALAACGPALDSREPNPWAQGPLQPSTSGLDVALVGPGFFQVARTGETRATRDGHFTVDPGGWLVNGDGWRVQGLSPTGEATDLQLGSMSAEPVATTNVAMRGNLAADAPILASSFDPKNPVATSNFGATLTIYDATGTPSWLELYFVRRAPGSWDYAALVETKVLVEGSLQFDASGNLVATTQLPAPSPATPTFDFGDALSSGGTGVRGLTQFGGTQGQSLTTYLGQDGSSSGTFVSASFDNRGDLWTMFSNGTSRPVLSLAVALVPRVNGLSAECGHLFAATSASGAPVLDHASVGGRGSVVGGALEDLPVADACAGR